MQYKNHLFTFLATLGEFNIKDEFNIKQDLGFFFLLGIPSCYINDVVCMRMQVAREKFNTVSSLVQQHDGIQLVIYSEGIKNRKIVSFFLVLFLLLIC